MVSLTAGQWACCAYIVSSCYNIHINHQQRRGGAARGRGGARARAAAVRARGRVWAARRGRAQGAYTGDHRT